MGFPSQPGQVGFRTQTVKGTYRDPGAAAPAGQFMRITSGALGGNRDLIVPDPEIGGSRDVPDAYLGPIAFAGEYNFYGRFEALATLMKGVLGAGASSSSGAGSALVGTHVITPATAIPWLSVEEGISDTFDTFNYTDAKVNTLHLEADAGGYLMGTAGLIALTQTAGATRTAVPDWDTTPMVVGTNVVVKWNTVQVPGKSFSFDANNNLEDDDFRLGSLFLGDLVEKRREVTAGVTIRPNDNAYWRTAVYGSPSATAPLGTSTKGSLQITATTYEVIGTSATAYSLDIMIPQAIIEPFALNVSGDDVMENDLSLRAVQPNPATPICTVTMKNGLAAIA